MKFYKSTAGFTLVEVLVSITILLLVIVGPMKIISRSINSTNFATQQVNAAFLAQEGLELAQKGRDDLVLKNKQSPSFGPFSSFITTYAECLKLTGCDLIIKNDGINILVTSCSVPGSCVLNLLDESTTGRSRYVHTGGGGRSPSPFTRTIKMVETSNNGKVREIKVTSAVTWRTGSLISTQKVEAVTYLFNVYDTK